MGDFQRNFFVTLILGFIVFSEASNILLIPSGVEFNSRLMNMLKIADFLENNGHNISILLPSTVSGRLKNPKVQLYEIEIPVGLAMTSIKELLDYTDRMFEMGWHEIINVLVNVEKPMCEIMLNSTIPTQLGESNFDLVMVDVFSACHKITAEFLNTSIVQYSNYGYFAEPNLFYLRIPSISCTPELGPLCTTEKPSFLNRLLRVVITYVLDHMALPAISAEYERLRLKYGYGSDRSFT